MINNGIDKFKVMKDLKFCLPEIAAQL